MLDPHAVSEFFNVSGRTLRSPWDEEALRQLSVRQVPREILGVHAWLLESDARLTWIDWFIDSLVDRSEFIANDSLTYARLYGNVRGALGGSTSSPRDEVIVMAKTLADIAWQDVMVRRAAKRTIVPQGLREDLWFAAEPEPRCYLCGYRFDSFARDRHLRRANNESLELPRLVDFTRPRGLIRRDLHVEVDHVNPVASGGGTVLDNLRLSCGWCNMVKSNRRSLLDTTTASRSNLNVAGLGSVAVPQPLWVLRIVATRGRCEAPDGCEARLSTHELFLAPINAGGALNPVNATVSCSEHDPWRELRYVGRGHIKS